MATKNIVPRANAQGQLGTEAKKWDKHIAVTGSFTTVSGSVSGNELTLVSGSAKSTGSFGRLEGNGAGLTGVTATASPAGSNTHVQFNDGGSTGGDAGFTYDKTANSITAITHITASGNISSSLTSTGSFGHIIKGGVNWDTAVSKSAATAGFGTGGGGSFTAAGISGSLGTNATLIRGLTNARISGSFTDASSSLASRITTAESELSNTLISGSAQIASNISGSLGSNASLIRSLTAPIISGSFTDASSSLASRVTNITDGTTTITSASHAITASHALNSGVTAYSSLTGVPSDILSGSAQIASNISGSFGNQRVGTTDDVTFASLTTTGDITARNYIVSSSVTYMTSSFSSGSTIFGDDSADTHKFTGSLLVTGSLNVESGDLYVAGGLIDLKNDGVQSVLRLYCETNNAHYAQIKAPAHSAFSGNVTLTLPATTDTVAGIASTQTLTNKTINGPDNTITNIALSSLASATKTAISGSLGSNATLIRGLTAARISGSSTALSSSLASRITTREAFITQSFSDGTAATISGSAVSTASFGKLDLGGYQGTIMRLGSTQVAAADYGAAYVFNVPTVTPYIGVGIIAENHNPHQFSILNKSFRGDGNFNYGITFNQVNSGNFDLYINATRQLTIDTDGNMELRPASVGAGRGSISGSVFSTGSFGALASTKVLGDGLTITSMSAADGTGLKIFDDGGNEAIWVEDGGYVGIGGRANPSKNLDIEGTLHATSHITSTGNIQSNQDQTYVSVGSSQNLKLHYRHGTSPERTGTNTNKIEDTTNAGLELVAGTPGIILVGHVTSSAGYNISGSASSTGSFGKVKTVGASDIGGALTVGGVLSIPNINDVSASIAAAVAGGDNLGNHTATQDVNLANYDLYNITHITASGDISSSISSTGSFGHIIKGGVNWDTAVSASAATAGFGTGGGGSFTAAGISGSLGTNAAVIRNLSAANVSGSFTSTSSSLASRIKTAESELSNTLISGSGQIATAISGAFTSTSSSLASRITTNEGYLNQSVKTTDDVTFASLTTTGDITARNYIVSSSVTYMTSSFSSGSTIFGDDSGDTHKFTGSLLVTGSFKVDSGNAEFAGNISGSATSTGSFGHIMKGGVNWDTAVSTSAAAGGFSGGGGSSFTAAGISGSLGTNASLIRGLTNARISGSFTSTSSSFASRITTREAFITQSFSDGTATLISGSATSTGSFGNLGIGTATLGSESSKVTIKVSNNGDDFITFMNSSAVEVMSIDSNADGDGLLYIKDVSGENGIKLHSDGASYFVGGNVGIGTISPANKLEVHGDFYATGSISGSSTSTGSFGHIMKGGVNWDTAVSTSAAAGGFGSGGGGSSFTAASISGSWQGATTSTGSFGSVHTAGRVGIGTTTLGSTLVVSASFIGDQVRLEGASIPIAYSIYDGSTRKGVIGGYATSAGHWLTGAIANDIVLISNTGGMRFGTGGDNPRMYISGTGDIQFLGTNQKISGSSTSTGSFGHIMKGGVNWDTAVSTSAAAGGFSGGGGSSFTAAGISGSWQSYSLISSSAQIKTQISGSWQGQNFSTTQSFSDGTATLISGSSVSTGSFGHIMKGGVNWDTAVSASAAAGGFGSGGGGSDDTSWKDGTATLFSGSAFSTASFGAGGVKIANGDLDTQVITREWDVSTISLDKYMQDGAPEWGDAWDVKASPDGRNVYVSLIGPDQILQYKLSGSWDIGSVSSVASGSVSSQGSLHRGMTFLLDGTKMITLDTDNSKFNEYNLTKPWDITTLTYVQNANLDGSSHHGLTSRPDGLMVYMICEDDNVLHYTLTTPFDISTMSLTSTTSVAAQGSGDATDMFFRSDGRYAYIFEKNSKFICEWKLSTPWVFSTAGYTGNKLNVPNIIKLWGNVEGTRLFGIDYSNERIYQYSWNGGPTPHKTSSIDIIGKTGIGGDTTVYQNLDVYGKLTGYSAEFKGDVSGSSTSTGSFGLILQDGSALVSGHTSAQISGSFTSTSSSLASRITTAESELGNTLISGSAQIKTQISGAFTATSGSFSTRVTDLENPTSVTADFGGYTFTTSSLQTTWKVTHNLNSQYPNVTVYDSNDEVIIPNSITANTISSSTIVFDSPVSGKAHYSIGGNMSGSASSTGSFGQVKGNIVGQRPKVTHLTHFTASMDYAGHYNIVGGNLTCSILAEATASVRVDTEFEFFQTSSAGTMLFETASLVTFMSKGGAVKLTGQYSGASLKKVATNTWHLVGDIS